MEYRRLGRSGLKVSVLSFGSWVTFGPQLDDDLAMHCMTAAYDGGVNFFDNAESYAGGDSERIMGRVISKLGWPRDSYVVSTKFFWGLGDKINGKNTLNRKYLSAAIDGSLDDWPVPPEWIADAAESLRWFLWDAGEPDTGWVLRLAAEDPDAGLAWAIAATDSA